MLIRPDKPMQCPRRMRQAVLSCLALFCAGIVSSGLTGCDKSSAGSRAAPSPSSQQAAKGVARGIVNLPATDYVADPQVAPGEQTAGPKRIISMAPSVTELIWAMGLGDRQIGRTQYCLYPPQAEKIPVVGALLDPNLERIMMLQPDMVLITASSSTLREKFAALNLPVHVLPDSSLADIFDAIDQMGRLANRPKTASALVRHLRADLDRLQAIAKARADNRHPKVIFVTGALPTPPNSIWVAGPGGYLDSLLRMASAVNMTGQITKRSWVEITPEQVVWQKPDAIIEVREPAQMARRQQAAAVWQALPGLNATRIVTLDEPAMLVPGPRVNVMLAKLIDGLYDNRTRQKASQSRQIPATTGADSAPKGANAD